MKIDPLEGVGFKITQSDLMLLFAPYDLVVSLTKSQLKWNALVRELPKRDPRWDNPAARQLSAIAGGADKLAGTDELRTAREQLAMATRAIETWMSSVLISGEFMLIGREDPVAGGLREFNSGIAWERARFDLKTGTARSRLKPDATIYDVRLAPAADMLSQHDRGLDNIDDANGRAETYPREKNSRFAVVDRRAMERARQLIDDGMTSALGMATIIYAEMIRAGLAAKDIGSSKEATLKRWRDDISKILQKTPTTIGKAQRTAKTSRH